MTKFDYTTIENFMLDKMNDSTHDKHHIYRVLNAALDIAKYEANVDMDILTTACLLHDIGRDAQFADPTVCHAKAGAEMAYDFLLLQGWQPEMALHVRDCISAHRFRGDNAPQTVEAKILFDADKLDVTGAIGIARTLVYEGQVSGHIYTMEDGKVSTQSKTGDTISFVQEYNHKLKHIHKTMYTARAKEIAAKRQAAAEAFYNALLEEIAYES